MLYVYKLSLLGKQGQLTTYVNFDTSRLLKSIIRIQKDQNYFIYIETKVDS